MKEVSVESIDHLRIPIERDSHEKFEKFWIWFEISIITLNFGLYVTTMTQHYEYLQTYSNFMCIYTFFIQSTILKCILTELLWVLFRLVLYIFCCPMDPSSQKALDSYNNIKYFSKKTVYLIFICYGFYELKKYFEAVSHMVAQDASVMIGSSLVQIQEDLWQKMFETKDDRQKKEHLEVIGSKYYRIKDDKFNKLKNEADQRKKGFINVPEANSEILEKCLIDEGFSVISNSTIEKATGAGSNDDEEQNLLSNNGDQDEIQTQKNNY